MNTKVFISGLAKAVVVGCVSLSLSGCITSQVIRDLSPEAKAALAQKFMDRCGGTVQIGANGGTGQMGGGFTANFQLTGSCPEPLDPPPPN